MDYHSYITKYFSIGSLSGISSLGVSMVSDLEAWVRLVTSIILMAIALISLYKLIKAKE